MLTIAYIKGYMRFGSYIEPNAFSLFTVVNIQGHTKKITLPISTSELFRLRNNRIRHFRPCE